jgi:UPF0271 protein
VAVIDLNCDMGEEAGSDELIMPLLSSASVACGFHAGDPDTIRATIRLARRHGVAVGAHPSYPDRAGFGRRPMARTPAEVQEDVTAQVLAVLTACRAEGVPLVHVKPHGALYSTAARDRDLARAICDAVGAIDPGLVVVCLAGSAMVEVVRRAGLRCAQEVFADRAYARDGTLVPRAQAGAVIDDPTLVADRAAMLVTRCQITSIDGHRLTLAADTLCVHGDTPGAARLVAVIRARLDQEGVVVRPLA